MGYQLSDWDGSEPCRFIGFPWIFSVADDIISRFRKFIAARPLFSLGATRGSAPTIGKEGVMKTKRRGQARSVTIDEDVFRFALFSALAILVLVLVSNLSAQAQISHSKAAALHESAPQSPHVYELPNQGPPTTPVLVQGAGFDPLTAIDVYFDSTKLASTTTDRNGSFGNGVVTATGATFTRIQVPSTGLPGQHAITAQERVGQKSAQIAFLVQTARPKFEFDLLTDLNPYENVLVRPQL